MWQDARAMSEEIAPTVGLPPLPRRVFSNRTLNLRSMQVVGCDMDYTLVHYDVAAAQSRIWSPDGVVMASAGADAGRIARATLTRRASVP